MRLPNGPIGLLSDAHGDEAMARKGVAELINAGARSILYLGDVCGDCVIDALAGMLDNNGAHIPARMVFGNMDFEVAPMTRYAESIGVGVDHPCGQYRCGESLLIATHGHLPDIVESALALSPDYFLHGHTHQVRNEKLAKTRVCNPGALHRARPLTVAVLDCDRDSFEIIEIA